MKKLTLTLLLVLAMVPPVCATTITWDIEDSDLSTVNHDGRVLALYVLTLPDDVVEESFISAILTLQVEFIEADHGLVELQVAEWLNGAPLLPSQKERFVSEVVPASTGSMMRMDITAILREALASDRDTPTLVIGTISDDVLGSLSVITDAQTNVWGSISLRIK